jgi:hypothetical protein
MMQGPGHWQVAQATGPALPIEQAVERARQYLTSLQKPDLALLEIVEFSNAFYVVVSERSTNKPAFSLVVNRTTGNVFPEMGPVMMWNTKYGPHFGTFPAGAMGMGGGMMGGGMGMGQGMMGPGMGRGMGPGYPGMMTPGAPRPGAGPGAQQPPAQRPQALDEAKARAALQAWINQVLPGATIGKVLEFPGYYGYRLVRDGRTFTLAYVNAYGGQVYYAWQYGTFVREQPVR